MYRYTHTIYTHTHGVYIYAHTYEKWKSWSLLSRVNGKGS